MASSFKKIAERELQNQMPREFRESESGHQPDQHKDYREIIAYQEDKIKHLYMELTKCKGEIEAREKACREKEKRLEEGYKKLAEAKRLMEQGVLTCNSREQQTEKAAETEKIAQILQKQKEENAMLRNALNQAQSKIVLLEKPWGDDDFVGKQQLRHQENMRQSSRKPVEEMESEIAGDEILLGYADIQTDIYMRGEATTIKKEEKEPQANVKQEERIDKIENQLGDLTHNMAEMMKHFTTITEFVQEIGQATMQKTEQPAYHGQEKVASTNELMYDCEYFEM